MDLTEIEVAERQPARSDALPLWVVALLILFVGLRVYEVVIEPHLGGKPGGHHVAQSVSNTVDDQTINALLETNLQAKSAFFSSFAQPGHGVKLDPKTLREALKQAETVERKSPQSPGAARRVILLRALLNQPPLAVLNKGSDPLAAFRNLPADTAASDKARYQAEGQLWARVFGGTRLSPPQQQALAAQIRQIPKIQWWAYPALMALYQAQGNKTQADVYAREARSRAGMTLAPLLGMELLWFGLGLLGLLLLLLFLLRAWSRWKDASGVPPFPNFWPTQPENVAPAERRLGAGDLMGVFALYLFMPDLIGFALTGFGVSHRFRFVGLLSAYRHRLATMPATQQESAIVVLEFFAYLIGAAVPIAVLLIMARRRGASLADELGWNRRHLGTNILYGIGGYAIGLPIVIITGLVASHIRAPEPTNPAIILLASASSFWVQTLLVLLATVAAPLTEELLFRGVFYNAAKLRVGVWPAIILTGLIFGFVHPVGIGEMLSLAVLGGLFAWMAETRKSLVPSMIGHFLQNSMATLSLILALAG